MRHDVLVPTFQRRDGRGLFVEAVNGGPWETLIVGTMKRGAELGHHYHKQTVVLFWLTKGRAEVAIVHVETGEQERLELDALQGVRLLANESHVIRFLEDSEFVMLKSLRYDPDDPDTFAYPVGS
jgi:dTDP-4-dehydrorhamnose 3,5-epimerase-like enzyme